MKLFAASDIAQVTGQDVAVVRATLMARVNAGFLNAYVVVPLGETINSPDSVIAFELTTPEVTG